MTDLKPISAEARMILAELHALRDEMTSMHQEARATLVAIRELFNELQRVETAESNIEHELEDVAQRLGDALDEQRMSLTSCSVCGSDVERHTAFADRRAMGERRTGAERRNLGHSAAEGPPDLGPASFDWTTGPET
ncbi:hypothetical protein H261_11675 [Paramagnetospirillum caucaseum]|uniref:Uncharacterized protein n=1 Tax=Paramagnetospirillum caucaseum TaxID=1244869 RepID=M2Z676_9PROT|nr:hypothetical protein [Paramagnetospirillum caucaseum]EME69825.1 hypothetical protein H261_11675 [Paramagnetospirillum caucaseum]